jgi:hypothetical protein
MTTAGNRAQINWREDVLAGSTSSVATISSPIG